MRIDVRLIHRPSGDDCGPSEVHVETPRLMSGAARIELVTLHETYALDENHAQALALALQAAIAEVQARAVQR